ncbi:MAG: hypothetical protein HUU25_10730 [Candidatus Sumerlaeia bacterium]|nr:hypothetical protein [Candidatus Sumerlaeia bacterium]
MSLLRRNSALRAIAGACALIAALAAPATTPAGPEVIFYAPHSGEIRRASEMPRPTQQQINERTIFRGRSLTANVVYLDSPGVGFNDNTVGADRRAVMTAVLAYIDSVLDHPAGVLDVEVQPSETDASGFLATAGTFYFAVNGFFPGFAFDHITSGFDPSGTNPDIGVTVDFGYPWNNDTGPCGLSEYDLYSVLLHEITHGLGIASLTNSAGQSAFLTPFSTNTFTSFDDLLREVSPSRRVWNATTQAFEATALNEGNDSIIFEGTEAENVLGFFPPIYTPATFAPGSSVGHWQFDPPTPPGAVMHWVFFFGQEKRVYEPFELGALQDLGYSIVTTPTAAEGWQLYH